MVPLSSGTAVQVLSALILLFPTQYLAFQPSLPSKNNDYSYVQLSMSTAASVNGAAPMLKSTLKKPSKVLTVGLEYSGGDTLSDNELSILSMQLRKSKANAIFCTNPNHAEEFSKEQATAQGNFPGPCPIIYHGPPQEGVSASAVVLNAGDDVVGSDCEVVWKVSSAEEVESVLSKTENAEAFLIEDSSKCEEIIQALPQGALCIASVESMQTDGAEVEQAKDLKKLGVHSIFVKEACVGDSEDLEYAGFVVGGMTSKASSEFSFSGLTGSTNGHFGGVQASGTVKWDRTRKD